MERCSGPLGSQSLKDKLAIRLWPKHTQRPRGSQCSSFGQSDSEWTAEPQQPVPPWIREESGHQARSVLCTGDIKIALIHILWRDHLTNHWPRCPSRALFPDLRVYLSRPFDYPQSCRLTEVLKLKLTSRKSEMQKSALTERHSLHFINLAGFLCRSGLISLILHFCIYKMGMRIMGLGWELSEIMQVR